MKTKEGLLLVQLGSPESLSVDKIEEFLYAYLGDRHTLGNPPPFWKFILKHFVLPKGKFTSFAKYERMFRENNLVRMPLPERSLEFLEKLRPELPDFAVELAFQYGCKPGLLGTVKKFMELGIEKLRVVPLYPQRAGVTTGAALESARKAILEARFQGEAVYANGYFKPAAWAREVANDIRPKLGKNDTLVLSWHSVQLERIRKGDPYQKDCEASAKAIGELLGVEPVLAYQSKFGRGKWIGPSLTETFQKLGEEHRDIVISNPSFAVDNLETIDEINGEGRKLFKAAGGGNFTYIECLNAKASWVKAFAHEILPALEFQAFKGKL